MSKTEVLELIAKISKSGHLCGVHMGQLRCRECGREWADTLLGDVLAHYDNTRCLEFEEIINLWQPCGFQFSLDQLVEKAPWEWGYTGDGTDLPISDREDWEFLGPSHIKDLFLLLKSLFA